MLADASLPPAFPDATLQGKSEPAAVSGGLPPATGARLRAEPTAQAPLFGPSPTQVAVRRQHLLCGYGCLHPPPPIPATFLNRSWPLLQSKFSHRSI